MVKTKIIEVCLITFLILMVCGCSAEPTSNETAPPDNPSSSNAASELESPDAVEEPVDIGPEAMPFEYILEPDFDRSSGIFLQDSSEESLAFDLNELQIADLSIGKWTVNEIEERFGAANEISGRIEAPSLIVIILRYTEMDVVFHVDRNGELSFDTVSNPLKTQYILNDEDKNIKMPLRSINLYSALPRDLVIGKSTLEQVNAAYPPDSGRELTEMEHILVFTYVDFEKVALSTKHKKPDTVKLNYLFQDDILVGAILYFRAP